MGERCCAGGFPKTPLAQRYAERARGADWEVLSSEFRVSGFELCALNSQLTTLNS